MISKVSRRRGEQRKSFNELLSRLSSGRILSPDSVVNSPRKRFLRPNDDFLGFSDLLIAFLVLPFRPKRKETMETLLEVLKYRSLLLPLQISRL